MKMEYGNLDISQQKAWVSSNAVNFVQNQAPCSNMSQKVYKKGWPLFWFTKNDLIYIDWIL
jgi:hypothetical protein